MAKRDKSKKGYHNILAWQRARALVLKVYTLTEGFPRQEMLGLTRQQRDAAISVASNIVEGYARGSPKQYLHRLNVSWSSLAEVEYYLELAEDLNYITAEQYESAEALRRETAYLLHRLMQSVAKRVEEEQTSDPSGSSDPSASSVSSGPSGPSDP